MSNTTRDYEPEQDFTQENYIDESFTENDGNADAEEDDGHQITFADQELTIEEAGPNDIYYDNHYIFFKKYDKAHGKA